MGIAAWAEKHHIQRRIKTMGMTMEEVVRLIVCILAGMATAIPLITKLVKYIHEATREKNWGKMLRLVISLMEEAEKNFDNGADRKEWVMKAIDALSETIDYDIDPEVVSNMIDALCAMAKIVNGAK